MPLPKRQPNYFQPQAKAYDPTMRDKAAGLLSGLFGDTYQTNLFSRGLLGSSGLGGGQGPIAGMGLLDMTPLGAAFALEEAGRKIGRGDRVGGVADAALAVVPIPAAARAVKGGAKAVARRVAPKAAKAAPRPGFVAYHGSPHTFDQFDTAKIGTGEGAQAYGHGLYFAENEGVAKTYRDKLALDAGFSYRDKRGLTRDQVAAMIEAEHGKGYLDNVATPRSVADGVMDELIYGESARKLGPERAAMREALRDVLSKSDPGSMYQVRINADPNDFLDWDRPLSAQNEKVRAAMGYQGGHDEVAGARLVRAYRNELFAGDLVGRDRATAPEVSRALSEKGIPGIRYLDQGSRGAGEGSRNFVVFDPRIIDIMKRYGVAAPVAAAILAGTMQPPKGREPGA